MLENINPLRLKKDEDVKRLEASQQDWIHGKNGGICLARRLAAHENTPELAEAGCYVQPVEDNRAPTRAPFSGTWRCCFEPFGEDPCCSDAEFQFSPSVEGSTVQPIQGKGEDGRGEYTISGVYNMKTNMFAWSEKHYEERSVKDKHFDKPKCLHHTECSGFGVSTCLGSTVVIVGSYRSKDGGKGHFTAACVRTLEISFPRTLSHELGDFVPDYASCYNEAFHYDARQRPSEQPHRFAVQLQYPPPALIVKLSHLPRGGAPDLYLRASGPKPRSDTFRTKKEIKRILKEKGAPVKVWMPVHVGAQKLHRSLSSDAKEDHRRAKIVKTARRADWDLAGGATAEDYSQVVTQQQARLPKWNEGLAPGWECFFDPATSAPYYINHYSRATDRDATWTRPEDVGKTGPTPHISDLISSRGRRWFAKKGSLPGADSPPKKGGEAPQGNNPQDGANSPRRKLSSLSSHHGGEPMGGRDAPAESNGYVSPRKLLSNSLKGGALTVQRIEAEEEAGSPVLDLDKSGSPVYGVQRLAKANRLLQEGHMSPGDYAAVREDPASPQHDPLLEAAPARSREANPSSPLQSPLLALGTDADPGAEHGALLDTWDSPSPAAATRPEMTGETRDPEEQPATALNCHDEERTAADLQSPPAASIPPPPVTSSADAQPSDVAAVEAPTRGSADVAEPAESLNAATDEQENAETFPEGDLEEDEWIAALEDELGDMEGLGTPSAGKDSPGGDLGGCLSPHTGLHGLQPLSDATTPVVTPPDAPAVLSGLEGHHRLGRDIHDDDGLDAEEGEQEQRQEEGNVQEEAEENGGEEQYDDDFEEEEGGLQMGDPQETPPHPEESRAEESPPLGQWQNCMECDDLGGGGSLLEPDMSPLQDEAGVEDAEEDEEEEDEGGGDDSSSSSSSDDDGSSSSSGSSSSGSDEDEEEEDEEEQAEDQEAGDQGEPELSPGTVTRMEQEDRRSRAAHAAERRLQELEQLKKVEEPAGGESPGGSGEESISPTVPVAPRPPPSAPGGNPRRSFRRGG